MDKQENGSESVKKELLQMFKKFAEQAQLGVMCKRLHGKWQKMRQTWLPGILYCYEIGGVPRNNLELEAVYGKLRANQRRISGRKETSPLRLFGAGEVMALMIDTEAELLEWCQTVAQDKLKVAENADYKKSVKNNNAGSGAYIVTLLVYESSR